MLARAPRIAYGGCLAGKTCLDQKWAVHPAVDSRDHRNKHPDAFRSILLIHAHPVFQRGDFVGFEFASRPTSTWKLQFVLRFIRLMHTKEPDFVIRLIGVLTQFVVNFVICVMVRASVRVSG